MGKRRCWLATPLFLCVLSVAMGTVPFDVVDLTHTQGPDTIYWPGNPEYKFTQLYRGQSGSHWYESNKFETAEHGGTHLDAPAHFYKDRQRVHEVSMDKLVGHGVIINVKKKAVRNSDYRVTVQDLTDWETMHGKIPEGSVVIMNSGWHKKYPNKTMLFGTNDPTNASTFHFPAFHEDAADWLVKNRRIHVLGVDTPSTDYGQSTTFPVHVILANVNVSGVENVANLDAIPEAGSFIYVASIKLYDGSGGQARVFATVPKDGGVNSGTLPRPIIWFFALQIMFVQVFREFLNAALQLPDP